MTKYIFYVVFSLQTVSLIAFFCCPETVLYLGVAKYDEVDILCPD